MHSSEVHWTIYVFCAGYIVRCPLPAGPYTMLGACACLQNAHWNNIEIMMTSYHVTCKYLTVNRLCKLRVLIDSVALSRYLDINYWRFLCSFELITYPIRWSAVFTIGTCVVCDNDVVKLTSDLLESAALFSRHDNKRSKSIMYTIITQ